MITNGSGKGNNNASNNSRQLSPKGNNDNSTNA